MTVVYKILIYIEFIVAWHSNANKTTANYLQKNLRWKITQYLQWAGKSRVRHMHEVSCSASHPTNTVSISNTPKTSYRWMFINFVTALANLSMSISLATTVIMFCTLYSASQTASKPKNISLSYLRHTLTAATYKFLSLINLLL